MRTKILFTSIMLILAEAGWGQTIASDSRGKDVFNFNRTKTFAIQVKNNSINTTYNFKIGKGTQYYYSKDTANEYTMKKSYAINTSYTVGNLIKNWAKISGFHPTHNFNIGIGNNIDQFDNWDKVKNLHAFWIWNLGIYGSFDNIIIYDINTNSQSRKKPFSKGVIIDATFFKPNITKFNSLLGFSFSFNYEKGNNISSLKDFQENNPVYLNSEIISLGDIIGKIGDIKSVDNIRLRVSLPFLPPALNFNAKDKEDLDHFVQLAIIPYYTFYGITDTKLNNSIGLFLNGSQGSNLFTPNSVIKQGVGIGIDWKVANNGISTPNIFISGTLDLQALFKHENKQPQK